MDDREFIKEMQRLMIMRGYDLWGVKKIGDYMKENLKKADPSVSNGE